MSKVVLIVEGHKDAYQVEGALGDRVETLVTEGTRVNNKLKDYILFYIEKGYEPYILSDPDPAGDWLSDTLREYFELERIVLNPEKCKYFTGKKYRYGVEYCSYQYLRELLLPYVEAFEDECV